MLNPEERAVDRAEIDRVDLQQIGSRLDQLQHRLLGLAAQVLGSAGVDALDHTPAHAALVAQHALDLVE